ncbi:MAG: cobalamin-binding protein [Bacteroidales bacterium]|nr:cobalamin-binding protein [Bacteroidales bacterium]
MPPANRPTSTEASTKAGPYPLTITDGLGHRITVSHKPERIVSLSPTHTETLFALGVGPKIVAVTTVDSYPPEVAHLPKAGGFAPNTISAETILGVRPDVVFIAGLIQEPLVASLSQVGLTVIAHEPRDFEEAALMFEQVGDIVGVPEAGRRLATDFRARVDAVRSRTQRVPESQRPRVFYALWDDPLQTTSSATFVGRMIATAGGVNIFADSPQHYPRISDETVLDRKPDLIISPDHGNVGLPGRLAQRPGWSHLVAVKNGQVFTVPEDLVNRSGPRLVDGLERIERIIRDHQSNDRR